MDHLMTSYLIFVKRKEKTKRENYQEKKYEGEGSREVQEFDF